MLKFLGFFLMNVNFFQVDEHFLSFLREIRFVVSHSFGMHYAFTFGSEFALYLVNSSKLNYVYN